MRRRKADIPDIIQFICDPAYLGPDTQISAAQRSVLKAIYGLDMDAEERDAFESITEGRKPRKGGYSQAWIIVGRRSGKTDKILANIAAYESWLFDPSKLSPGEQAFYPLVAQNVDGASRARGYIEGKLLLLESKGWDVFDYGEAQQRAITAKEIRLRNKVTVKCFPCGKASVRGITALGYAGDEVAWWRTEDGAYNADVEVLRALNATVATMGRQAKRVVATSPYAEEGVTWNAWERRHQSRALVVNCPSWVFNPNLDTAFLESEQLDDPVAYLREYGAQFGKEGGGYFTPTELDRVLDKGRPEVLRHRPGYEYTAAIDVAHKHDLYSLAIGHREDEVVIFDRIEARKGSKKAPLDDAVIAAEYGGILREYGLDTVQGDQHFDLAVVKEYKQVGVKVNIVPQDDRLNYELYKNLKAAIRRGMVSAPDTALIRKDLLSLRRMKGGKYPKIKAPDRAGFHDDISKSMSVVLFRLLNLADRLDLNELNALGAPTRDGPDLDEQELDAFSRDIMGEVF